MQGTQIKLEEGGREGALLGSIEDRRVHIAQLKTHSKTNV